MSVWAFARSLSRSIESVGSTFSATRKSTLGRRKGLARLPGLPNWVTSRTSRISAFSFSSAADVSTMVGAFFARLARAAASSAAAATSVTASIAGDGIARIDCAQVRVARRRRARRRRDVPGGGIDLRGRRLARAPPGGGFELGGDERIDHPFVELAGFAELAGVERKRRHDGLVARRRVDARFVREPLALVALAFERASLPPGFANGARRRREPRGRTRCDPRYQAGERDEREGRPPDEDQPEAREADEERPRGREQRAPELSEELADDSTGQVRPERRAARAPDL